MKTNSSFFWTVLTFITTFFCSSSHAKLVLLMGENFEDCTKGGAQFVDFSGIDFEYLNDTYFLMTGKLVMKRKVEAPWKSYYYIEKYDRLQWHRSMIDRHIPDFCTSLDSRTEPWAVLTSHFKQRSCPYEAGYEETFDNEEFHKITSFVAYSFIGKYRVFFYSYFKIDGRNHTDCMKISFEIKDF